MGVVTLVRLPSHITGSVRLVVGGLVVLCLLGLWVGGWWWLVLVCVCGVCVGWGRLSRAFAAPHPRGFASFCVCVWVGGGSHEGSSSRGG